MKSDIRNREDIYLIVCDFYKKLMVDEDIKHFFVDFTAPDALEHHLQILVDFWDNIIFYSGTYARNAMKPHLLINKTKPFKTEHFTVWLKHFFASIDANFEGENAHAAKTRAQSIATVMQLKMNS